MSKKPTVFISHVSENLKSALTLRRAFQQQALVRPWIAHLDMEGGDKWEIRLKQKIKEADFFVPLISPKYNEKEGKAQAEVRWALDKAEEMPDGKPFIIPVGLRGNAEQHPFLGEYHTITGKSWDSKIRRLNAAMGVSLKPKRKSGNFSLVHNGGFPNTNIATPCFFPSISGAAKIRMTALDLLNLVVGHNPLEAYLVSAYDIDRSENKDCFLELVRDSRPQMQVLLDSGIYEQRWLHREKSDAEKRKIWHPDDYYQCAQQATFDACFPYDNFSSAEKNAKRAAEKLVAAISADRNKLGTHNLYPILHPRPQKPIGNHFISFCVEAALSMPSSRAIMLAIPERDLGNEIFEVASNIKKIRLSLNKRVNGYCPLHILGAGNPLSILVYSACGADSFDGIDWCQTVAEYDTGRLYHPYHFPLFDKGEYPADIAKCSPMVRLLAHNLSFYARWMGEIQRRAQEGTIEKMLTRCLTKNAVDTVRSILKP